MAFTSLWERLHATGSGAGSDTRHRVPAELLARINMWRERWGVPTVTSTGAYDPLGLIHEAERDARRLEVGTVLKYTGQALQLIGTVSGNGVVKAVGMAIKEGGKLIVKDAQDGIADLADPLREAFAAELAHWFVATERLRREGVYVVRPEAGADYWPPGAAHPFTLPPSTTAWERVDDGQYYARFLPLLAHPVMQQVMVPKPDAMARALGAGPAYDAALAWRRQFRTYVAALRSSLSTSEIRQATRQPVTPEALEALQREEAPFRAVNRLHPPAARVLRTRPEWAAKLNAARERAAAAKVEAALATAAAAGDAGDVLPPELRAAVSEAKSEELFAGLAAYR